MKSALLFLTCLTASHLRAATPAADVLAAAPVLTAASWVEPCSTVGAALDFNEPILSGLDESRTVWWKWTAPFTGTVDIARSNPDDFVAAYEGSTYDTLALKAYIVPVNLTPPAGTVIETMRLSVTAGRTYAIQVETVRTSGTTATLSCASGFGLCSLIYQSGLPVPANDAFAARTAVSGAAAEFSVTAAGCGNAEPNEPVMPIPGVTRTTAGATAWYEWTAPAAGQYEFSVANGGINGYYLSVYRGSALASLSRLAFISTQSGFDQQSVSFQAAAGEKIQLQMEGQSVAKVRMLAVPRPPNDDFASAPLVSGSDVLLQGWSRYASREAGEPLSLSQEEHGSIWWRWTAPAAGYMSVGNGVTPYTGSSVSTLTRIIPAGSPASAGDIPVTAGQVIHLAGVDSDGRVDARLRFRQPPANEVYTAAVTLSGLPASTAFDSRQSIDGAVWYQWTAPFTGDCYFDTRGTTPLSQLQIFIGTGDPTSPNNASTVLYTRGGPQAGSYQRRRQPVVAGTTYLIKVQAPQGTGTLNIGAPPVVTNDHFQNAATVSGTNWSVTDSTLHATGEFAEPLPGYSTSNLTTLWWKWTAPDNGLYRITTAGSQVDTALGVYTGSSMSGLTSAGFHDANTTGGAGTVMLRAVSGTTYAFQVDQQGNAEEGATVTLGLSPWSAPANDAFSAPVVLSGSPVCIHGTLRGATAESGEPVPFNNNINNGRSVWYSWTSNATGRLLLESSSSDFDPGISVFTGTAVNALTQLGSNGGRTTNPKTNALVVQVSTGTTYRIAVDGLPQQAGDFRLCLSVPQAPANDAFATRILLAGEHVQTVGALLNATAQSGEPRHDTTTTASRSAWWTWTAPRTAAYAIDTSGSSHRLILAVYTGTALNALTNVAWDKVTGVEIFSSLTLNAIAGTTYQIALDVQSSVTPGEDPANLNIQPAEEAVYNNDNFAQARVITGVQMEDTGLPRTATAEAGEPAHGGTAAARSRWWKYTPATNRRVRFWTDPDFSSDVVRLNVYRGSSLADLVPVTSRPDGSAGAYEVIDVDLLGGVTYYIAVDSAASLQLGGFRIGMCPPGGRAGEQLALALDGPARTWDMTGCSSQFASSSYPPQERWRYFYYTSEVCRRVEWRASAGGLPITLNGITTSAGADGTYSYIADLLPNELKVFSVKVEAAVDVTVQLRSVPEQLPLPSDPLAGPPPQLNGSSYTLPVTLGHGFSLLQKWEWISPVAGIAEWKLEGSLAPGDALRLTDDNSGWTNFLTSSNGGSPVWRVSTAAGQKWQVWVQSTNRVLRSGQLRLTTSSAAAAPANDNIASPQILAPAWTSFSGDLTTASRESGEGAIASTANPASDGSQRSLWYQWTPADSGPVTLRLLNANATFTVEDLDNAAFQSIARLAPGRRQLTLTVLAGRRYRIGVATRSPLEVTGSFTLSRVPVAANDLLSSAVTLSSATASSRVDSAGSTIEPGEPGHANSFTPARATLWWRWTAPVSGLCYLNTHGSEFDTILSVFPGTVPSVATRLAENDNASGLPGATESAITLPVTAGSIYTIRIDGQDDSDPGGFAQLNLSMNAPPAPYQCWLADFPQLAGAAALPDADPDGDGHSNLAELAFGTDPLTKNESALASRAVSGGWQTDVWLDTAALAGCGTGRTVEVQWQASPDLQFWTRIPDGSFVRQEGPRSLFRVQRTANSRDFIRLRIVP